MEYLNHSIPVVYQGQEQGYNGNNDPYDREAVCLNGFFLSTQQYMSLLSSSRKICGL